MFSSLLDYSFGYFCPEITNKIFFIEVYFNITFLLSESRVRSMIKSNLLAPQSVPNTFLDSSQYLELTPTKKGRQMNF